MADSISFSVIMAVIISGLTAYLLWIQIRKQKVDSAGSRIESLDLTRKNTNPLASSRLLTVLIVWVLLGFLISFLLANILINGKMVTPGDFGNIWGMTMVITFSLGIPILFLLFRWQKRKEHRRH